MWQCHYTCGPFGGELVAWWRHWVRWPIAARVCVGGNVLFGSLLASMWAGHAGRVHAGHPVASWWPDGVTGFVGPLQHGCVSVAMCWLFGLPLVSMWAGHVGRLCIVQSGCPSKATVQCVFFLVLGNFGRCLGGGDAVHF